MTAFPQVIRIELTYRCNMNCDFCFNKSHISYRELPTKDILKILSKIKEEGIDKIKFTGGEPLLRKDLLQIVKFSKKIGLFVMLNTNGLLVTKENLKIFNYVDDVLVSIHKINEKELKQKIRTILKLRHMGKYIRACTILTRENIENLEFFYYLVNVLDPDFYFLLRPVSINTEKVLMDNQDVAKAVEGILAFNKKYCDNIKIQNSIPFCSYDPDKMEEVATGGLCDNGFSSLVIDNCGNIKTDYFSDEILGNALKDSIMGIWHSKKLRDIRNFKNLPESCTNCKKLKECKGGLRFAARNESNMDSLARYEKYKDKLLRKEKIIHA